MKFICKCNKYGTAVLIFNVFCFRRVASFTLLMNKFGKSEQNSVIDFSFCGKNINSEKLVVDCVYLLVYLGMFSHMHYIFIGLNTF